MISSIVPYGGRYQADSDDSLSPAMTRSARRGPWLPEEDQALLQLVRTQGANNWVRISQQLQHRSPKQCRERYHQNLKPSLKHDPISAQEGEVIERLVQEMGKRWAEIARRLGNRSDNAVKNWWNGSVNRRRRNPAHSSTGFKQVGTRLQPVPFTLPQKPKYSEPSPHPTKPDLVIESSSYESRQDMSGSQLPSPSQVQDSTHTNSFSASIPLSDPPQHGRDSKSNPYETRAVLAPSSSLSTLCHVRTSNLRPELPPIRSSSFHLPRGEKRPSTFEHGPISPALSDSSQRQVPSLVSDTQSMYSISPRTVTTPRPGMTALVDVKGQVWPEHHGIGVHNDRNPLYQPFYHAEPHSRTSQRGPVEPALPRPYVHTYIDDRSRDSRMNVSTLLQ